MEQLMDKRRQEALELFNIRNGNVCSLCEQPLKWTAPRPVPRVILNNQPIALTTKRAICRECFAKLKERYH